MLFRSCLVDLPVDGRPTQFDLTDQIRAACSVLIDPICKGITKLIATFDPEFQARLKNRVLLAGGSVGASLVTFAQVYDCRTGAFSLTGSLPEGRAYHSATLLRNGKVLIAGGYNGNTARATAFLYDPATGAFAPTGSLNFARGYHSATLLNNGKVLIAGGLDETGIPSAPSFTAGGGPRASMPG